MCSRISISISRWPWRRRESRTPAAWGAKGGASAPGEAWPPSPLAALAARRRAPSQRRDALAPSGCRRGRSLDHDHGLRLHKAALCAAEKARAKLQSGQERPPRRRRYAAPALTPRGVAPALVATTATVPSRQTNRRTARGGLSTTMRPIVPSLFIARSRCPSDRSATEEMSQIV